MVIKKIEYKKIAKVKHKAVISLRLVNSGLCFYINSAILIRTV